ncbi:MAG: hypothetical protein ISN64_02120 [Rickettsia sp.]|nr:hypothetical protein [Rickettsia sp.]
MFRLFFSLVLSSFFITNLFAVSTNRDSYFKAGVGYRYFNWDVNKYLQETSKIIEYYPKKKSEIQFLKKNLFYFVWNFSIGHYFHKNVSGYFSMSGTNLDLPGNAVSLHDIFGNSLLYPQTEEYRIDLLNIVDDLGLQNSFLYTNVATSRLNNEILSFSAGLRYDIVNLDYVKFFLGGNLGLTIMNSVSAVEYDFGDLFSKNQEKMFKWIEGDSNISIYESLPAYLKQNSKNMSVFQKEFFDLFVKNLNKSDKGNDGVVEDDTNNKLNRRVSFLNQNMSFMHRFKRELNFSCGLDIGATVKPFPGAEIDLTFFIQSLGRNFFNIDNSSENKGLNKNINKLALSEGLYFGCIGANLSLGLFF